MGYPVFTKEAQYQRPTEDPIRTKKIKRVRIDQNEIKSPQKKEKKNLQKRHNYRGPSKDDTTKDDLMEVKGVTRGGWRSQKKKITQNIGGFSVSALR